MALLGNSSTLGGLGIRFDPVLGHNFLISLVDSSSSLALGGLAASAILDVALGGFSECSGIEMTMTPEEYKEGGRNGATLKFPNRVTWSNVTLKKGLGLSSAGVGLGTTLWEWHYGFVEGKGKRRDGFISLMDDLHVPHTIWYFRRGLPVKYTGPTLNAAQNGVAIESMEIAHEGIYQVPFVGVGAAAISAGVGVASSALRGGV